jgi:hypothetical protein
MLPVGFFGAGIGGILIKIIAHGDMWIFPTLQK